MNKATRPPPVDCESLKSVSLPDEDAPPASMAASLKGCSSEALYFGIEVQKDPVRARQCAYLERQDPDNGWPNLFAGTGMLMTIYANGIGAPLNFDIAMKLACELNGAPAEEEGWIAHLQKLKKENWQGQDFSPCDDITSGAAMGYCEAHEAKLADAARKAKLAGITAHWPSAERKAFAALEKTKNAYAAAVAENEVTPPAEPCPSRQELDLQSVRPQDVELALYFVGTCVAVMAAALTWNTIMASENANSKKF